MLSIIIIIIKIGYIVPRERIAGRFYFGIYRPGQVPSITITRVYYFHFS